MAFNNYLTSWIFLQLLTPQCLCTSAKPELYHKNCSLCTHSFLPATIQRTWCSENYQRYAWRRKTKKKRTHTFFRIQNSHYWKDVIMDCEYISGTSVCILLYVNNTLQYSCENIPNSMKKNYIYSKNLRAWLMIPWLMRQLSCS